MGSSSIADSWNDGEVTCPCCDSGDVEFSGWEGCDYDGGNGIWHCQTCNCDFMVVTRIVDVIPMEDGD